MSKPYMLTAVRQFIKDKCPCLGTYKRGIGVDLLGEDAISYVIETVPVDPIIKRYINGSAIKRFCFVFASKRFYGSDVLTNIENIGFFEEFTEWFEVCERDGVFPNLGDGREVLHLKATLTPYLYDEQSNTARYQIQCELQYFEKER